MTDVKFVGQSVIAFLMGLWYNLNRPVSRETLEGIRRAAQLARERKDWTREMHVEQGRRDLERARADAIARGIAIDEDWEAAIGD